MAKEKMKWYQEATIKGEKMPTMRSGDTNEKRWQNLILPLLPFNGEGRLFIELGSNAGFYLRKAKDLGFEVIGVENNPVFIEQARYWEDNEPKGVKTIEYDLNNYDLPCSSIVLLANVHYWLTDTQVKRLVRRLQRKALYVIVVGRRKWHETMQSSNDPYVLKRNFRGFELLKGIKTGKHCSYLFKSKLIERDTGELVSYLKKTEHFYSSFIDFIEGRDEMYRRYLARRVSSKDERWYQKHVELVRSVRENGILQPIVLDGECVVNGNHRLVLADYLGQKKIVCQKLSI